jgi:tight adherence protein B
VGALLGLMLGAGLCLVWFTLRGELPPLRRRSGPSRIESLLRSAGIESVSVAGLGGFCVTSALVAGSVMLAVSQTVPVAAVFALLAAYVPLAVVRGRAQRRRRELAELWPEAVDNLASADSVGDRVVEALRIAREVGGGDLGRMLRTLSGFLRDDARTRSELESRQAWTVNGARLAVAAPWVVLLLMSFQPDVISRYASPAGVVVLAGGAVACVLAYRLMTHLGRLPEEERVLA